MKNPWIIFPLEYAVPKQKQITICFWNNFLPHMILFFLMLEVIENIKKNS